MTQIRAVIKYDKQNEPYFLLNNQRRYIKNISKDGYDETAFINCGYFGGFRLVCFENEKAVLDIIE